MVTIAPEADLRDLSGDVLVLLASAIVEDLPHGDVVEIRANDPDALVRLNAWSRRTGNRLVAWTQDEGEQRLVLQRR